MIRIFIGYDSTEVPAYHVLEHSIIKHASAPVSITPVKLSTLRAVFARPREGSTEFSLSRFLVPYLCNFQGFALFMDCDMLLRADIARLWDLRDARAAVQVCKHDYTPISATKMRGAQQTLYQMKNWSSVMLFNCTRCTNLTPHYVNEASGLQLHQFHWVDDPDEIGSLPLYWNHLVSEYAYDPFAKNVHWTLGGPWWHEYAETEYAEEWFEARQEAFG